ncbi:formyltransferase family protein, partial [Streptomyces sp. WAC06614]|uniref:formyltransferase family protein n=1 Tax=Streptomyces sp. WAC06614 TaxID=2487416 RepID=UPI000FB1FB90
MHILLVASAFNSLTQRVHAELRDRGHQVAVELAVPGTDLVAAVDRHDPDLLIAPMLRTALPEPLWSARTCLVVHPGPPGDRGPSSLDHALHDGAERWGVTVLQANAVMDGGDIWAAAECAVPPGIAKSDLYRGEIADAALAAVLLAVERFASGRHTPEPQTHGLARPVVRQDDRRIDWAADPTERVLRLLRAADSRPGVRDELLGATWYLHGGRPEPTLRGRPGELLATRDGAVCRATVDGAVWIPELRAARVPGGPEPVKLPATLALGHR